MNLNSVAVFTHLFRSVTGLLTGVRMIPAIPVLKRCVKVVTDFWLTHELRKTMIELTREV